MDAEARFCGHCGADSSSEQASSFTRLFGKRRERAPAPQDVSLELLREHTLGEYEILGELGRGGMATVYLAHEIALGRKVALKVLVAALLDPNMVERFKWEARTAAGLSHPHIIPVYAVRESHPLIYLTMKFIAGCSLESIIKEQGALPIPLVLTILTQVGYALGYAHRQGVIHRDVKPGNVMIDQEGWVVVTDFGIAKATTSPGLTATGSAIGTPSYMSPEQWRGEVVSGASDQYSLGVVAYEMLSGVRPFVTESAASAMWAHVNEAPRPIQDLRPDCPTALAQAVMRMLEKSPSRRWPTIEEAVRSPGPQTFPPDDLTREHLVSLAQTGAELQASRLIRTPVSPVPSSRRIRAGRRSLLRWLGTMAAVAVLGAGIAWWSHRTNNQSAPEPPPARPVAESVTAITIAGVPSAMTESDTVHLEALPKNSAGSVLPVIVAWATTDPAVVAVSDNGRLTAVGPGVATITASAGGRQESFRVVVQRAAVASLEILPLRSRIGVKHSIALQAAVRDAAGNVLHDRPLEWATSEPAIATVSGAGVLTGLAPGVASITASSEGVTSRPGTVLVVAPPAPGRGVVRMVIIPWAYVSLDGIRQGRRVRGEDTLTAGSVHRLRFEREGFVTVDTTVTLRANQELLLTIQMTRRNP